jgi:hypothetical protein
MLLEDANQSAGSSRRVGEGKCIWKLNSPSNERCQEWLLEIMATVHDCHSTLAVMINGMTWLFVVKDKSLGNKQQKSIASGLF